MEAFKELAPFAIGILTLKLLAFITFSVKPLPSLPIATAHLLGKLISFKKRAPSPKVDANTGILNLFFISRIVFSKSLEK